jgi:hypothetical protein
MIRSGAVPLALVAGLTLLGCGSPYGGGSPAQQVTAWAKSTGFGASLARLRGDLAHVSSSAPGPSLRTACDVLVTDTLGANQQLPTPDGALTGALADAYAKAGAAGRDCFRGAAGDQALLGRAAAERAEALAALVRAEARFDALTSPLPGSSSS